MKTLTGLSLDVEDYIGNQVGGGKGSQVPVASGLPIWQKNHVDRTLKAKDRLPRIRDAQRFGNLSKSSFFNRTKSAANRHRPFPKRVRHIRGLLDTPICSVLDDRQYIQTASSTDGLGLSNAMAQLSFPPNAALDEKLKSYKLSQIKANTQRKNEKIIVPNGPWQTFGIINEPNGEWKKEVRILANKLGIIREKRQKPNVGSLTATHNLVKPKTSTGVTCIRTCPTPKSNGYSEKTGRIIPSSSRNLMSRASRGKPTTSFPTLKKWTEDSREDLILQLLCQMLKLETPGDAQNWLTAATEEDKTKIESLLKKALTSLDTNYGVTGELNWSIEEEDETKGNSGEIKISTTKTHSRSGHVWKPKDSVQNNGKVQNHLVLDDDEGEEEKGKSQLKIDEQKMKKNADKESEKEQKMNEEEEIPKIETDKIDLESQTILNEERIHKQLDKLNEENLVDMMENAEATAQMIMKNN
ncbi:hypothetical protein SNEBB_011498 [Seison nebaliae]|nr:hypothetical protein SNEBB_011498 [Seison nebaliae]